MTIEGILDLYEIEPKYINMKNLKLAFKESDISLTDD